MLAGATIDMYLTATEAVFMLFSGSLHYSTESGLYHHRYRQSFNTLGHTVDDKYFARSHVEMCPNDEDSWLGA